MKKVTNEDLKKGIDGLSRGLNIIARELKIFPAVMFFKDKKSGKIDHSKRRRVETLEDFDKDFEDLKEMD